MSEGNAARAADALASAERIAVLTGAGVSAASGLATFRGAGGRWRRSRPEDLATPGAYRRDPERVWAWYAERRRAAAAAGPNAAHRALASLAARTPPTLVTQNVDGLHRRAGSPDAVELHGNLFESRCERCGAVEAQAADAPTPPRCGRCGARARPNVVWFGEPLPAARIERAVEAFARCEVALVVGTSARVEPAASLARLAAGEGAFVIEVNPEPTPLSAVADVSLRVGAVAGTAALLGAAPDADAPGGR